MLARMATKAPSGAKVPRVWDPFKGTAEAVPLSKTAFATHTSSYLKVDAIRHSATLILKNTWQRTGEEIAQEFGARDVCVEVPGLKPDPWRKFDVAGPNFYFEQ